jgi:hypothetical protein
MNSIPILPERLDWSSAIGLFLINFGTLDYLVFVFLKDHLPPDEFAKVNEWHLKDRVDRIAKLLQEEKFTAEQQAAFARLCENLKPIRNLRNHIAHGHMYFRLDLETQNPTVTVLKAKDLDTGFLLDTKHVEFAELVEALTTLDGLVKEFQHLVGFRPSGCATVAEDEAKSKCLPPQ